MKKIDYGKYQLELSIDAMLHTDGPAKYVTEVSGRIVKGHTSGDKIIAGCISLTLHDVERALAEGQAPMELFECGGEEALELYRAIYDGRGVNQGVRAVVAGLRSPSLLVIESVEVRQRHRGGLGLAAALKAMQLLGPKGGMVALRAAPLMQPVWGLPTQAEVTDLPQSGEKLGKYWEQLGFRPLNQDGLYLRSLENLPTLSELLASQR